MPRINGENGEVKTKDIQPESTTDQPKKTLSVGTIKAAPATDNKRPQRTGSFSKVLEESTANEPLRADSSPLQSPRSVKEALKHARRTSQRQMQQDGAETDYDDELVTTSAVTRLSFLRGSGQRANVTAQTTQTDPKAQANTGEGSTSTISPS